MTELDYMARAEQLWQEFTELDRKAVRLRMWPLHKLHKAWAEGYQDRELYEALKKIAAR